MTIGPDDRIALSDLVHRYAACIDDRAFASATTLFTDSAELILPDPPGALKPEHTHRGRAAIAAAVAAVDAVTRTEHAIVGEVYDGTTQPGNAKGRITCVAHHWSHRGDDFVDAVWHLRYDDDYEHTAAGWRISRRTLTINAIETRPVRRLLPRDPA
jgi:SnoaL-like domain